MNGLFGCHLLFVVIVLLFAFYFFVQEYFDLGVIGIGVVGIIDLNPIYMAFKITSSSTQS